MDENVFIPNVTKQSYVSIDEILTPEQREERRIKELNRLRVREELRNSGIDPDSDEGLLANPHESFLARKA
jgi:hypothetical protein